MSQEKPKAVKTVQLILWVTIAIGLVRTFLEHQKVTQEVAASGFGSSFVYFVTFTSLAFMALQIYLLGKGKNWARWLFVILFAIGIPTVVMQLMKSFSTDPIFTSIGAIQTIAQVYACVLLFTPEASKWYKRKVQG